MLHSGQSCPVTQRWAKNAGSSANVHPWAAWVAATRRVPSFAPGHVCRALETHTHATTLATCSLLFCSNWVAPMLLASLSTPLHSPARSWQVHSPTQTAHCLVSPPGAMRNTSSSGPAPRAQPNPVPARRSSNLHPLASTQELLRFQTPMCRQVLCKPPWGCHQLIRRLTCQHVLIIVTRRWWAPCPPAGRGLRPARAPPPSGPATAAQGCSARPCTAHSTRRTAQWHAVQQVNRIAGQQDNVLVGCGQ